MSLKEITSVGMFNKLQEDDGIHVVKISTATCGPCKMMAPIFEKIAEEQPSNEFYSLVPGDVEGMPEVMNTLGVSSVPTFLVFKNGELTSRVTGAHPKSVLLAKLGL